MWEFDEWGYAPGGLYDWSMGGAGDPTAYDRGDAVRGGAGVGAALGFAAGVATGVPNGGGVGSISGGFIGGAAGGGLYDIITNGDGSAVLGDNYNPMGDYVGNYGGGGG